MGTVRCERTNVKGGSHYAHRLVALFGSTRRVFGRFHESGRFGRVAGAPESGSPALHHDTTVYSFNGGSTGGGPAASLILHDGVLYGTAQNYGAGHGTVFSVDGFGRVRNVYSFAGRPDGGDPQAGLVWYNGAFYGTTSAGGVHNLGTLFSVTAGGVERVLHSFGGRGDGASPVAGLVEVNSVLYGTTEYGGAHDKGVVFEFSGSGEAVVHSFAGSPTDGGHPSAGLIRYKDALYGTTRSGGKIAAGGTVYKITPFGDEAVLHSFGLKRGDGENPAAALVEIHGEFYGTTLHGGNSSKRGTVFAISPGGTEQILHAFGGGSDGANPIAGLIVGGGELYGTTMNGGLHPGSSCPGVGNTCGTIFAVDAFGREKVVYRFRGHPDGANPEAPLTYVSGALFGTTTWGGAYDYYGTVFSIAP